VVLAALAVLGGFAGTWRHLGGQAALLSRKE
jgi:hypothetical protein